MTNSDLVVQRELSAAGYDVTTIRAGERSVIAFENDIILGFAIVYPDVHVLLSSWPADRDNVLRASQFALKRSAGKAWNAYLVLLAETPAEYAQSVALYSIEEDLVGLRKIARAGVGSPELLKLALLPLLPLQDAPRLEAVDMPAEIRLRTSELPASAVEAFLGGTSDGTLLPLLEEGT